VLLEPLVLPWPTERLIAEWYDHVREPALSLFILGVGYITNVLQLIALLADSILFDPVLFFSLLCLIGLILSINLIKAPRALLRGVVEFMAFDPVIKTVAGHNLEVPLIAVKRLVANMVLPQDLFWSNKGHAYLLWKGKLKIDWPGFYMGL
jgi:hypothetical protein